MQFFNGSWFYKHPGGEAGQQIYWDEATNICHMFLGKSDLTSIHSQDELEFIR